MLLSKKSIISRLNNIEKNINALMEYDNQEQIIFEWISYIAIQLSEDYPEGLLDDLFIDLDFRTFAENRDIQKRLSKRIRGAGLSIN
ncbi:hypothetical protein A9Y57_00459 [Streptococcus parauberis]|uniref:Uncharacterized protein n=1 Tax=Streptococcus parauberis TaxID=1348 RepID=A0A854WAY5_9STRE|nr:hypothetical protein [Streptococcus parauberis]PCH13825.1 hypothetical protein A9Y57_00459 [Streptococcus parauberis]